jgi:hypothetical protein
VAKKCRKHRDLFSPGVGWHVSDKIIFHDFVRAKQCTFPDLETFGPKKKKIFFCTFRPGKFVFFTQFGVWRSEFRFFEKPKKCRFGAFLRGFSSFCRPGGGTATLEVPHSECAIGHFPGRTQARKWHISFVSAASFPSLQVVFWPFWSVSAENRQDKPDSQKKIKNRLDRKFFFHQLADEILSE